MNVKNKIVVLLLAGFFLAGFGKKAEAGFYTTLRSTAVQVVVASSFSAGVEVLSVSYSTGSSTLGDQFIVLIDTDALENDTSALGQTLKGGTTLQNVAYGRGRYPVEQYLTPPIVVFTTAPLNNPSGASTGFTKIDFRDGNGCGVPANEGVLALQPGVAYGTVVTVEWRPRPQGGPCRDQ